MTEARCGENGANFRGALYLNRLASKEPDAYFHLAAYNQSPSPFVWTAKAADILPKVTRAHQKL